MAKTPYDKDWRARLVREAVLLAWLTAPVLAADTYLGQTPPWGTPEVFARGIVSTDHLEHSAPAISPDGSEILWSLWRRPKVEGEPQTIMEVRRERRGWSKPAAASFSGGYNDGGPVFAADGRRLYFYSDRPVPGVRAAGTADIWIVEKSGTVWGTPRVLGLVQSYPWLRFASTVSVASNGTLYFIAYEAGPLNDYGIYRSECVGGTYQTPQALPRGINLPPFLNWTPYVAPDESYLLFSSNRRDPEADAGDLYISRRSKDGGWSDPVPLGAVVNSKRQERFPALSPDRRYLFFTRPTPAHDQDIYWVRADLVLPTLSRR